MKKQTKSRTNELNQILFKLYQFCLNFTLNIKQKKALENVQSRDARFVKKYKKRTPETITRLLKELEWPVLEQRRKKRDCLTFTKR